MLDSNGKTDLYIESPLSYKTDGKEYYPHVHFATFNNKTKDWNKEVFTVSI